MKRPLNLLAAIGLVIGAKSSAWSAAWSHKTTLRSAAWGLDGTAMGIVAGSFWRSAFFPEGKQFDAIAAGFLVYAIGEAVMLGSTAASLETSIPAFAAGVASLVGWAFPHQFPQCIRHLDAHRRESSQPFCLRSLLRVYFRAIRSRLSPGQLPYFAYPILVITFIGWIVEPVHHRIMQRLKKRCRMGTCQLLTDWRALLNADHQLNPAQPGARTRVSANPASRIQPWQSAPV